MNWRIILAVIASAFSLTLAASPAAAQATRTWVSGVGSDANPCSRTAPCKTFAGAIVKTAAGGEINCLDPAGFGGVTVNKSLTIDCTGTLGGILASSTFGVTVNAAGARVVLRGLQINGGPPNLPGTFGVRFLQGTNLIIENCSIYNFLGAAPNGWGIVINNTSSVSDVYVINTTISNNGTASSGGGINVQPTGTGAAILHLRNVRVDANPFNQLTVNSAGTTGVSGITVVAEDSEFNGGTNGISVTAGGGGTPLAQVSLVNSVVSNAGVNGITSTGASASVRVGNTTITGNAQGLAPFGGSNLFTFGDNRLTGNGVNGTFNGGLIMKI